MSGRDPSLGNAVSEPGYGTPLDLTQGGLLRRNVLVSLLGQFLPLIAAVALIPPILRGLGPERFGLLTIVWLVVGYFSLLDLGLGRALTRAVAAGAGRLSARELAETTWTSLVTLTVIGCAAAVITMLATRFAVERMLPITEVLRPEAEFSLYIAAASIPVVILTAAMRGLLEAHQRFGAVNAVRTPSSILTYASPLVVLPFTQDLRFVVAALVLGRLATLAAFVLIIRNALPGVLNPTRLRPAVLSELLRAGTWMTVSSILAPLMLTADRVMIAAFISVSAVSYYATPYEVITKIWVVAAAFSSVMFPAFATSAKYSLGRARRLYGDALYYLVLVTFPLTLVAIAIAPEALELWLGTSFSSVSSTPTQILGVGVFYSSVALLAFSLVQAIGRPAVPALLQFAELPLYVFGAVFLIQRLSLTGAAIVWTLRIVVDALALVTFGQRIVQAPLWPTIGYLAGGGAALALPVALHDRGLRLVVSVAIMGAFIAVAWGVALRRTGSRTFGLRSLRAPSSPGLPDERPT